MANSIMLPYFFAIDSNGDPLTGGKVYVYTAGTSNPVTTYQTSALSTANAHPVVLDALGSADIWVADGNYKVVVKDADDVTLQTVDNIEFTSASVAGDLATLDYVRGTLLYGASATGTDAYAISVALGDTVSSLTTGMVFRFKADVANTGAATLNVTNTTIPAALGATTIVRIDGSTLTDGDIPAGSVVQVIFDGTNFQLTPGGLTEEQVEDFVGGMVGGASVQSGITVSYDDVNGELDFTVSPTTINVNNSDATVEYGTVAFDVANASHNINLNLKLVDADEFKLRDPTDVTKLVSFDASPVTTATEAVITLPPASGTLVTNNATQTLTNKTLTSPAISGATLSGTTTNSGTISGGTITGVTLDSGLTITSPTISDPTISGTITSSTASFSGTFTGGTFSGPTLSSPTLSGGTFTGSHSYGGTSSINQVILNTVTGSGVWDLSGVTSFSEGTARTGLFFGTVVDTASTIAFGKSPGGSWSIAAIGTGQYRITHPMATANFIVTTQINAATSVTRISSVSAKTSTTFDVFVTDETNTARDSDFEFTVISY